MTKMTINLKMLTGEKPIKDDKDDNAFENAQWTKVKKDVKDDNTFENAQWRKVKKR